MANTLDQINFADHEEVQRCAFSIIDRLQGYSQGVQVSAAALLFLMLCHRFNASPTDVLSKSNAMLLDCLSYGRGEQARAIKTYLAKEL